MTAAAQGRVQAMRRRFGVLVNSPLLEAWPGGLLRARGNRDARLLATADAVLRRKSDGTYLAVVIGGEVLPLRPAFRHATGIAEARRAMAAVPRHARPGLDVVRSLPVAALQERLDALGLDAGAYAEATGLSLVAEPAWLALAGRDRYGRALWLHVEAARAWRHLQGSALRDGVVLEAISGYRSHDYQLGIFARKRTRGQTVDDILAVNAAPGFSEHHGGRAIDIGAPGEPAAEESFEGTPAFAWLREHAHVHGFAMSYPRGNPHGIVYEPWHWLHVGRDAS